jgi:hypothetical protein
MQLIQFWNYCSFSITISNNFIREDVYLGKMYVNGYELMGFDVTPLTQDTEQNLFTITTHNPILLA